MSQTLLELENVRLDGSDGPVLEVSRLEVVTGEVLAVVGPNGSGKSTLLQVMAGLLRPSAGRLLFSGREVSAHELAGYRRRLALVMQSAMLLDRSVRVNVELGLRFRHFDRAQGRARGERWSERLGVAHLLARRARSLSGGEAQRVSLARAFAVEPELLLLDEPFAALDTPSRRTLLADLRLVLSETGTTTVMVTHDMDEAMSLSDRVAVLVGGRLRQVGRPQEVFSAPADEDVAAFVGVETALAGRVSSVREGLALVAVAGREIAVAIEAQAGENLILFVRPEDVTLSPPGSAVASSARNRFACRLTRMTSRGRTHHLELDCGFPLVASVTELSVRELGLAEGGDVVASFKATAVHSIRRGHGVYVEEVAEAAAAASAATIG